MTRGWTLQELIAPHQLKFYDNEWCFLGEKIDLVDDLARISGVDSAVLRNVDQLPAACCTRKISWASGRSTSRPEDRAYSLLGILGVTMPLLYGEGSNAFVRLQRELIRISNDHSIFIWQPYHGANPHHGFYSRTSDLLATRLEDFENCWRVTFASITEQSPFELTNVGLRITIPISHDCDLDEYFAIFNCRYDDDLSGPIAIVVEAMRPSYSVNSFLIPTNQGSTLKLKRPTHWNLLSSRHRTLRAKHRPFATIPLQTLLGTQVDTILLLNPTQNDPRISNDVMALHWPPTCFDQAAISY